MGSSTSARHVWAPPRVLGAVHAGQDEGRTCTAPSTRGWNAFPVCQDCPTAAGRTQITARLQEDADPLPLCPLPDQRGQGRRIYCPRRLHPCAQRDLYAIREDLHPARVAHRPYCPRAHGGTHILTGTVRMYIMKELLPSSCAEPVPSPILAP